MSDLDRTSFTGGWADEDPEPRQAPQDPASLDQFMPTWVRAAEPYGEDHFALADERADAVRLMSNESPFPPSPRVLRAIVEAAQQGNRYPASSRDLRARLAEREGLDASSVLLGCGSTELIDLAVRTFVAPGEEVLITVPTFSMYEARARLAGGVPVLVPLRADRGVDVSALERAVTERTKLVFVCTPNNPTGLEVAERDLDRVLALGLPTVVDEAYRGPDDLSPSPVGRLEERPNAIVLRTFSKAFGLAGMRLGYAIGHPAAIRLLSRVKLPWNVPGVVLAAALAALDDLDELFERLRRLRQDRDALAAGLDAIPGVKALPGEGNFILVDVAGTRATANQVVAALWAEGVLIRSLQSHHGGKHFVRVTVGTPPENARCVRAFERAVVEIRRGAAVGHAKR